MKAARCAVVALVLAGCSLKDDSWLNADENYTCTVEQMQKVEHETVFCRDQVKSLAAACYGGAIMRNCTKRVAK